MRFNVIIGNKSVNLPIYKRIFTIESNDAARLREERRKLQSGNILRVNDSVCIHCSNGDLARLKAYSRHELNKRPSIGLFI